MPNDKKISQLISLSRHRKLDKKESAELDQHLGENKDSRNFAKLSQLIEKSVAAKQDAELMQSDEPGSEFSKESKQRLKKCIRAAVEEKKRNSQQVLTSKQSPAESSKPASSVVEASVGKRELISRFNLIRRLEQYSPGNIWLARDEKLDRIITIKELDEIALDSPQAWKRFHREASITGNLQHPNIVSLYQFGVDRKSGEPFCAMQLVGERTLADAIREYHDQAESDDEKGLNRFRLLNILLNVSLALKYAHAQGVIHCDLRPQNVALDSYGQTTLMNWGLAKIIEGSELARKLAVVSPEVIAETNEALPNENGDRIHFLSPEQTANNLDEIDEVTDVYGLGAVLYAILTGRKPPLPDSAEFESLLAGGFDSSTPNDLVSICIRSMARQRSERYASVHQFAEAIENWLAGQHRT